MELHKLAADEIRGWDQDRANEAENEIRLELANIRMDIYTAKTQTAPKVRGLKRSLARILTVRNEKPKTVKEST